MKLNTSLRALGVIIGQQATGCCLRSLYAYIHIQIYTRVYTYKYIHIILKKMYAHTNLYTLYIYKYIHIQIYTHTNIYTYKYIRIQIYTHTYIYTYKYIHIYIPYTRTCIYEYMHVDKHTALCAWRSSSGNPRHCFQP